MKQSELNISKPELILDQAFDETIHIKWKSPSNIALIKYWGKHGIQLPKNASVSFTLSESVTITSAEVSFSNNNEIEVEYYFENQRNLSFESKIVKYFSSIGNEMPFLKQLRFKIESTNTFPHSAGIASSASSMSALALILCDLENQLFNSLNEDAFYEKASHLARLGSGSASRSVYGNVTVWGQHEAVNDSSDMFAVPVGGIHPIFKNYQDSVLIVDGGVKKVSSRAGHALMNDHAFAERRFVQANDNLRKLLPAMQSGDVHKFIQIVENEALSLHAMMMTSSESFVLMKPNTLHILDKITSIREQKGLDICFTLDAGPNVHLLYPESIKKEVQDIIRKELIVYCERNRWINDYVGAGPERL